MELGVVPIVLPFHTKERRFFSVSDISGASGSSSLRQGNKLFKEQNYPRALAAYHKVFMHVNGLSLPQEDGP